MIKKFFSAILIVFAFLLLNVSLNLTKVEAAELPPEIFVNAGFGEKQGYWAIINYGADYIGDSNITIDIQQEAIANEKVNSISIVESGYSLTDLVHYERDVSPEFASKISYSMKNTGYGTKNITILLLTEFSYNPEESLIVDKITVEVNQKRKISELSPDDILVIKEKEEESSSPYKINVTLPEVIEGKGTIYDYVFESVTYTLQKGSNSFTLGAINEGWNNYYFNVSQNGEYLITVKDIFGCVVTKTITVDNLVDPEIIIEVEQEVTTPTNADYYMMNVKVRYYDEDESNPPRYLNSDDLNYLGFSYNNSLKVSIIENMQVKVEENGIYVIYAESNNGSLAELTVLIDNIDREDPFVNVLEEIVVYTENAYNFDPKKEIFVYDNVSSLENGTITVESNCYTVSISNGEVTTGSIISDYVTHLYKVKDLIVKYLVRDEAGNSVEVKAYVRSVDNTKPIIYKSITRKDFYINDSFDDEAAIKAYIEEVYGLIVTDNSIYEGSSFSIDYSLDFSMLPLDQNNRLNMLGLYYIYASAIDEAGNISDPISLVAEVRQRLVTVQAKANQYIVYGDKKANEIKVEYECVTRAGELTDCVNELLEGDTIIGELYVLNATYVGEYEIHYDKISIPSKLYYLAYGNVNIFEIKKRVIPLIADNKQKAYLDDDPPLTYKIDERYCDPNDSLYNKDYRCTFVQGSGDAFMGNLQRYKGEPPAGVTIWHNEDILGNQDLLQQYYSEAVWYDSNGQLVARDITIGTVDVYEVYNGGVDNYDVVLTEIGKFMISPKSITVYLKDAQKIYGEMDPVYEIAECRGGYPINGASIEFCTKEIDAVISRMVEGEIVHADDQGNYVDYYRLGGVALNTNYVVEFFDAYLTILRRDVSISVEGDKDEDGNPTGKYTIYYENQLPHIKVYDSSNGNQDGLVDNPALNLKDRFSNGKAAIYTQDGELVVTYVNGIGIYIIRKGDVKIVSKDNTDAEFNYNITFNEGILEVIKKEIWVRIIKDLSKIYGDEDKIFKTEDLEGYNNYVILEANGRFIIEITPSNIAGEEPYIPRDNEKMKYHLKRDEGIYVGDYPIKIEKLEGCENYDVFLYADYKYQILKRDLKVTIDNQTIIYRETPKEFTYNEGEYNGVTWESSLQYDDYLSGKPEVEKFRNVGVYDISVGSIVVLDPQEKDVTFNYNMHVHGGKLTIIQREVVVAISEGQSKQYGEDDPLLVFSVYYKGIKEEMPSDDYEGKLGREAGEEPGEYIMNWGTFKIKLNGLLDNRAVGNYLITEYQNNYKFAINKRDILVKARDVTAIYGNAYSDSIRSDTNGGLAYNLTLEIDDEPIHDYLVGELKVLGEVNGVGTYTISCEDIKILRYYTQEDVTYKYYNFTYENGVLTILPRTIKIKPDDGQFKTYGESDIGITYTYSPELLDEGDEFVGTLMRKAKEINGKLVTEFVGQYEIELGTLSVKTPSGKPNYELVLDGSATFSINPRDLTLKADDLEIEYGDEFELTYTITNGSLANNPSIGIVDTVSGELILDREYSGYGTYMILGTNLVVSNVENYNYNFLFGILIVNKKALLVTPTKDTLSKVYGENDPLQFNFTTNVPGIAYSGGLTRIEGENAGKYRILIGTLDFGPNYDVTLKEEYFVVLARVIQVIAQNNGKLYGTDDPKLIYDYIGTLVGSDRFYGSLEREYGEEVGDYAILQGSLSISNNYEIQYTPGVFSIIYAEFTGLTIYSLTNNQYQVKGEEKEVQLYARFNEGADESDIGSVEWKIIKNEDLVWEFTKDEINHVISFFPSGSIGTYVISATYKGITAYYTVFVELSLVGNVYIRHVSGETTQTLGRESLLTYMVIVPDTATDNATVEWVINGMTVQTNPVKNIYFDYMPNLGKGEFAIQARIGGKISEPLYFYIRNNNAPIITLNGDSVIYIEAREGEQYIEPGATVEDDIDGDITDSLVITGYVNENEKGIYYIRYEAKDSHGNNAISVYRQVVVRDTTPPIVTLNGNKEMKILYGQQYIEYGATANDNYDGEVEVTINNPINTNKIGKYEVIYVAYDEAGNRGTATRYVEVIDNISPIISLIGDEITYVEVYEKFEDDGALIIDNVDGTFVMMATSFFFGNEEVNGVDTSRLGTYYVHYDYQDTAGNIGAGKVRIVIVRDSTAPVINLIGTSPYIIRYSYPDIGYEEPGAIAVDNYDTYVPVTITGTLGNELGSYFLYYNAVDSHGNIAKEVVREVVIIDIQNPIIHFYKDCPQYMTIEAMYETYDTRCDAPGFGVWVEDDYQADLVELQKRVVVTGTVDDKTVGLYIIKYDVKDMAGNSAVTLNRYVQVVDTTAPVIKLLCGNGNECGEDTSQIVEVFTSYEELGAVALDKYDEYHNKPIEIIVSHNINVMRLGEYTVTYNATDSNGNRAEFVIRKVYVKDTTPPEITILGKNPMTIERGTRYVEDKATVMDNYDGYIDFTKVTITNAPSGMSLGEYKVTYKVMDSSGNIGEAVRIVHVVDTLDPVVLGVEHGKYYKDGVSIHMVPTIGTDEVLTGWLNGEEIPNRHYVGEEGVYELVVVDDAGNDTYIWFAIDNTPPEILGVKNGEYTNREKVVISSNEKIKYYEYRYNTGEWIRVEEQTLTLSTEGTYYLRASDMANNITPNVITFVIDRTAPNFSLTGVINKGITNTDVRLNTEEDAIVAVNAMYNIPTLYTFTNEGYYQIVIRDLAGNVVKLQFVINKTLSAIVDKTYINILSQHNAINKVSITGNRYPRNSGIMIAKPLIEGGFEYVSGKLFSETEYQTLMAGKTVEIGVSPTDDTYMFVGFVVLSEELNKFGSQTVEGDDDENNNEWLYIGLVLLVLGIILLFFVIFLKRRKKQEEEEEVVEEVIDDTY